MPGKKKQTPAQIAAQKKAVHARKGKRARKAEEHLLVTQRNVNESTRADRSTISHTISHTSQLPFFNVAHRALTQLGICFATSSPKKERKSSSQNSEANSCTSHRLNLDLIMSLCKMMHTQKAEECAATMLIEAGNVIATWAKPSSRINLAHRHECSCSSELRTKVPLPRKSSFATPSHPWAMADPMNQPSSHSPRSPFATPTP